MRGRVDSPIDGSTSVPVFNLLYDHKNSRDSAVQLAQACDPIFRKETGTIKSSQFTDGITNTLMKVTLEDPSRSKSENDRAAIVLRIYGQGTDTLIDRAQEIKTHELLASKDLAPPLLARFGNGIIYRFCPGDVCSAEDLRRPEVYREVARTLGKWHRSLPVSAISSDVHNDEAAQSAPHPNIWTVLKQWIDMLPCDELEEVEQRRRLQEELFWIVSTFAKLPAFTGQTYVFSHADLLSGNIILERGSSERRDSECARRATFIDYEYAIPAPSAFDIANHFSEWAGFDCDYSRCPTRAQRLAFLHSYLDSCRAQQVSRKKSDQSTESGFEPPLQKLFQQVDLFRGIPGLFWGVWSLHQDAISSHSFDYKSYAKVRLDEYWSWKAEFDGSREREGRKKGAREMRWAQE